MSAKETRNPMITDLTRETLHLIRGKQFRLDAARYVDSYEAFLKRTAESGIGIDTGVLREQRSAGPGILTGNSGKSLYYGRLSPACVACRTGAGSKTVFHTLACNRGCFFCANMNQQEYAFFTNNINDAEKELAQCDPEAGYSSIGLTGGEPLLLPDKALGFFKFASKTYPEAHKRLYSNGDLLTDELAEQLAAAGVNEIRISIKADETGYSAADLESLVMAKRHIPCVMVEMPVLPGSVATMKKLFLDLEELGVDGINILEFLYPWLNAAEYTAKGYQVKKRPYRILYGYTYAGGLPIAGSEEACLELLDYAAAMNLNLNVHYCSLENKLTAQIYQQNAGVKLMPYEVLSAKDFFIKIARAYTTNGDRARRQLETVDPGGYQFGDNYLEFHPRHIDRLAGIDEIALTYNVVESGDNGLQMREVKIDLVHPAAFDYDNDI